MVPTSRGGTQMEDAKLLGLLNPTIAIIFAMTFIVFWLKQKDKKYILAIGLSYGMLGVGFLAANFIFEKHSVMNVVFVGLLYVFAITTVLGGLYNRAQLQGGVATLLIVGLAGVGMSTMIVLLSDNMNLRIYVTNATLGCLFCIAAWRLRCNASNGSLEKLIVVVFTAISIQFIVLTAFTLYFSGVLTPENYRNSLHWVVINFTTAISSLVLALMLIGVCSSDLMQQITKTANTDVLTGLQTRRAFEDRVAEMMLKLERTPLPVSLLILDIDHFKKVNDQFGHPVGDRAIKQLGGLVIKRMRTADVAGRLGGEEFSIMLWNTDQSGARLVAEELRSTFSTLPIEGIPDEMNITVSIGVATAKVTETYESLYSRADRALYDAKHRGRNRVAVAKWTLSSDTDKVSVALME